MNSRLMESEPIERRKLIDRAAIALKEGRLSEAAYLGLKRRHEPLAAPAAVPAATPDDNALAAAEQQAKKRKLGLWNNPNPIAPWDWRK